MHGENILQGVTHIVIGDIHGRREKCRELLRRIGVISVSSDGPTGDARNPGFRIHQLGDAVSLGYGEREVAFLEWFGGLLEPEDVLLLGNHELPAVWFSSGMNFQGYDERDPDATELVQRRFLRGGYRVASSVGPWLITHAGVLPKWQDEHGFLERTAEENAAWLQAAFEQRMLDRFDGCAADVIVGKRGDAGGIFWCRWDPMRASYAARHVKQVIGHTTDGPTLLECGNLWLLDTAPVPSAPPDVEDWVEPPRSEWGGVAALVFADGPDAAPTLVHEP